MEHLSQLLTAQLCISILLGFGIYYALYQKNSAPHQQVLSERFDQGNNSLPEVVNYLKALALENNVPLYRCFSKYSTMFFTKLQEKNPSFTCAHQQEIDMKNDMDRFWQEMAELENKQEELINNFAARHKEICDYIDQKY